MAMEAALVAGPTRRNTSAAPADAPFVTNSAASGVDALAQT